VVQPSTLDAATKEATMRHHKTAVGPSDRLANLPGVGSLPRQTRACIDSTSVEVGVRAGSSFIHQGRPARQTFITTEGEAAVRRDGDLVAVRSAGHLVGETAVMLGGVRTAGLVALTDMRLLVMSPAEFMSLREDPAFGDWAQRSLEEHLLAS
jgi:CRP-like cAMP-binding protein